MQFLLKKKHLMLHCEGMDVLVTGNLYFSFSFLGFCSNCLFFYIRKMVVKLN